MDSGPPRYQLGALSTSQPLQSYSSHDALSLAELVRTKQVSPRELVQASIERIESMNPKLNAVVHRMFEVALKQAEGPLPDGPFRGVPFMLKDLLADRKSVV